MNTNKQKEQLKKEVRMTLELIVNEMERSSIKIKEKTGALAGAGVGGTSSLGVIAWFGGGVSIAGLNTGLGVLGSIVGGTLATGAMVIMLPVVVGGLSGYYLAKQQKQSREKSFISLALKNLQEMQDRLSIDVIYFKKEITLIEQFSNILKGDAE